MNNIWSPLLCVGLLCAVSFSAEAATDAPPLEIHEWGVWVRSEVRLQRLSPKGLVLKDDQRHTQLAAPHELLSDMPEFVRIHQKAYQPHLQSRVWRKPVIHLYGATGTPISVKVMTPQGHPTAYWPMPGFINNTRWQMGSGRSEAVGMTWSGTLEDDAPADLPEAPAQHWWSGLRKVPSAYVKTAGGSERFIFYEGTAVQEPLVTARVEKDAVVVANTHDQPSDSVLLIVNDGHGPRFVTTGSIPSNGQVRITKDDMFAVRKQNESLASRCAQLWTSFGLTKEEVHAMYKAWEEDLNGLYGFLLISRMPVEVYDKMFPLTVTPKPTRVVRVGLVFDTLAGQSERAGWLKDLEKDMDAWAKDLRSNDSDTRADARQRFRQVDYLAQARLETLSRIDDLDLSNAAAQLLRALDVSEAPAVLEALQPSAGE